MQTVGLAEVLLDHLRSGKSRENGRGMMYKGTGVTQVNVLARPPPVQGMSDMNAWQQVGSTGVRRDQTLPKAQFSPSMSDS